MQENALSKRHSHELLELAVVRRRGELKAKALNAKVQQTETECFADQVNTV